MRGAGWFATAIAVAAVASGAAACGGAGAGSGQATGPTGPTGPSGPTGPPAPALHAPVTVGDFTFYGTDQGLTPEVSDASADEGGNVYVAGGAALFVKARGERDFRRIEPEAAGLTRNCWDPSEIANETPPGEPFTCPIISVAGAAPGRAIVGFQGVGTSLDEDARWATWSGGADVIAFDGAAVTRERHVFIASPPGVVCEGLWDEDRNTCSDSSRHSTWGGGRKKSRQVVRIVVNHDRSRPLSYGDVLFDSTHGTLSILAAHPDERGWLDLTNGDPAWADTKGVWEHHHPAYSYAGRFLTGWPSGVALDPTRNVPWFSNGIRTASMPAYATDRHPDRNAYWGEQVPARPHLAFWGDAGDPAYWDDVTGLSFCDDGALWVASNGHGLKRLRVDADGNVTSSMQVNLPGANRATAIACDPDGSVWVGFLSGGFGRWKDGRLSSSSPPAGAPAFTQNPVTSIQLDRWTTPRIVYLTHLATATFGAGGVTVYAGP
jgi:hypothetical protein